MATKQPDAHRLSKHAALIETLCELDHQFQSAMDAAANCAELQSALAAWHETTLALVEVHRSLCGEIQALADQLESKNHELEEQRRLAQAGVATTKAAARVRQDLITASLYLNLLRRRLSEEPGHLDVLAKVESGVRTVEGMLEDISQLMADRQPKWQYVPLVPLVERVLTSLEPQLAEQSVQTVIDIPHTLHVVADRDMLRRAILNLAIRALSAMPDGGGLTVTAFAGRSGVEIELADSGPGLREPSSRFAAHAPARDRAVSADLGLACVERIARLHGGDVVAVNCPEGGAAFTLRIPHHAREAA